MSWVSSSVSRPPVIRRTRLCTRGRCSVVELLRTRARRRSRPAGRSPPAPTAVARASVPACRTAAVERLPSGFRPASPDAAIARARFSRSSPAPMSPAVALNRTGRLDGLEDTAEGWNVSAVRRRGRSGCPPTSAWLRSGGKSRNADVACLWGHCPRCRRSREPGPSGPPVPFLQAVRVALEVGVVIAVLLGRVELIDRDAAGLAVEQPGDRAVLDRDDRRVAGRQDVDALRAAGRRARLSERADQLSGCTPSTGTSRSRPSSASAARSGRARVPATGRAVTTGASRRSSQPASAGLPASITPCPRIVYAVDPALHG